MQVADTILHVKTGIADVLIVDVIRKFNFRKMNLLYLLILYRDMYSNFACSIAPQISCIMQKIKICQKIFSHKTAFLHSKMFGIMEFFYYSKLQLNLFKTILSHL